MAALLEKHPALCAVGCRVVSEARELMRGDATEAQQVAGPPLPADEARQAAAAAEWVDAARRFQMRLQLRGAEVGHRSHLQHLLHVQARLQLRSAKVAVALRPSPVREHVPPNYLPEGTRVQVGERKLPVHDVCAAQLHHA